MKQRVGSRVLHHPCQVQVEVLREILRRNPIHRKQRAEYDYQLLTPQPGAGQPSFHDDIVERQNEEEEHDATRKIASAEDFVAFKNRDIPRYGEDDDRDGAEDERPESESGRLVDLPCLYRHFLRNGSIPSFFNRNRNARIALPSPSS